ncbi:MAG: hypothetical protein AB7U73_09575 [Pirellulales bacterium]
MKRNWRVIAAIIACFVVPGLLALLGLMGNDVVWTGNLPLTVTIDNTSGAVIRSIDLDAFARLEPAEAYMEGQRAERGPSHTTVDPFEGKPIELVIHTGGRQNAVWGETAYFQEEHLVVIARCEDGTELAKYARIPDSRRSRALTVTLP